MGVNITTIAYLRVKKSSELGKNNYFNGGFSAQGVGYNLLILSIDPSTSVPRTSQVDQLPSRTSATLRPLAVGPVAIAKYIP